MNYQKIYNSIVENRQQHEFDGYTEKHHIVPRSLGGDDTPGNIVSLSSREHFICHYLLAKMYEKHSFNWYKMNHAFMIMKAGPMNRYVNSRLYESLRLNFSVVMSKMQSGTNNSQHGTRWISNVSIKECRKIPNELALPAGWSEGRILNWDNAGPNYRACNHCREEYLVKTTEKYCSVNCQTDARKSKTAYYGREEEFLELYSKHKSMNKALKEMGFPGAMSHWYKWAKDLI